MGKVLQTMRKGKDMTHKQLDKLIERAGKRHYIDFDGKRKEYIQENEALLCDEIKKLQEAHEVETSAIKEINTSLMGVALSSHNYERQHLIDLIIGIRGICGEALAKVDEIMGVQDE